MDPTALWPDTRVFPKAARRVIATVEEIVDGERIRAEPDRVVLPSFAVNAVVHAPFGAHPTSCFPRYGYDSGLHLAWAKAARDPEAAAAFLDRHVRGPASRGVPRRRRRRPGPVLARAAGERVSAPDYTVNELMIARVARVFDDGDQVVNGMASFVPVCAYMLARRTHAPNLVWLAGAVGLDPRPQRVPA